MSSAGNISAYNSSFEVNGTSRVESNGTSNVGLNGSSNVGLNGSSYVPEEVYGAWEAARTSYEVYMAWYGIWFPVVSGVGIIGNLVSLPLLCSHKNRSLSTMIMAAQLVADIGLLVCITIITCPQAWAFYVYDDKAPVDQSFWNFIDFVQKSFIHSVPILELMRTLTIWYALVLIVEQFFALTKPVLLDKLSKGDGASKTVVSVMCLALLVVMVFFFKYVLRDKMYTIVPYKLVCLSEAFFGASGMEGFDMYIFPICFLFLPWGCVFVVLPVTAMAAVTKRKADIREWQYSEDNPASGRIQEFKSGRSLATTFTLTTLFLLLYGGITGIRIYMYLIGPEKELDYDAKANLCLFFPTEIQYLYYDPNFRFVSYVLSIIYAVVKFPVLFFTNSGCRTTLRNCCKHSRRSTSGYLVNMNLSAKKTMSREAILMQNMVACKQEASNIAFGITPLPDDLAFVNSSKKGPCVAFTY